MAAVRRKKAVGNWKAYRGDPKATAKAGAKYREAADPRAAGKETPAEAKAREAKNLQAKARREQDKANAILRKSNPLHGSRSYSKKDRDRILGGDTKGFLKASRARSTRTFGKASKSRSTRK